MLILSKNQLLVLLIYFTVFCLFLISLISALIFAIFLLLLFLGFICCSFSSSLRYKVRLCIWDLSSLFRKAWNATYFLLGSPLLHPSFLVVDFKFHSVVIWIYAWYGLNPFTFVEDSFVIQYVIYFGEFSKYTREECVFWCFYLFIFLMKIYKFTC